MANLKDVMAYILSVYPKKVDLTKGRLTKIIYLADWKAAMEQQSQVTEIKWFFDHYGPFVHDVGDMARHDSAFKVAHDRTRSGHDIFLIELVQEYKPKLSEQEKKYLDFAIQATHAYSWDDFIRLVYSTYPIRTQARYTNLNLVELAKDYLTEKDLYKLPPRDSLVKA